MKLECKLSNLRSLIAALSIVNSELVIECNSKGIKSQCMDSNHVGLVMFTIPKKSFKKYTCESTERLGLNLDALSKILACGDSKDDCILSTSKKDPDVVNVTFFNNLRTIDYDLKLLDLSHQDLSIPSRDEDIVVTFPSSQWKNIISDISKLGDDVIIKATQTQVHFKFTSDAGSGTLAVEYSDELVQCKEYESDVSQMFALKYLKDFSKACDFCSDIELRMLDKNPVILRFSLPKMSGCMIDTADDGTNTQTKGYGTLLYFLAQKVNDDE